MLPTFGYRQNPANPAKYLAANSPIYLQLVT
jgi:hypothetical protein